MEAALHITWRIKKYLTPLSTLAENKIHENRFDKSQLIGEARRSWSTSRGAGTSGVGGGAFPVRTATGTAPAGGDWRFSTCGGHSGGSAVLQ